MGLRLPNATANAERDLVLYDCLVVGELEEIKLVGHFQLLLERVSINGLWGTLLTSLTYSFILLVIALEMADVETPSCRAACANRSP
jgi:hypothetical protein